MAEERTATAAARHQALDHELVVLLRRVRGISQQLAADLHPDVQPSGYSLLARLDTAGAARVTDLAHFFRLDVSTASRQVTVLRRLGLVQDQVDPSDRRAVLVELSPGGKEALEVARGHRRDLLGTVMEDWPSGDVDQLVGLLQRLNEDLERAPLPRPTSSET